MSDRQKLFQFYTNLERTQSVALYMDGESGTWRLYFEPSRECVDLTLHQLWFLRNRLNLVLENIRNDPEKWNAEVRARKG